MKIIRIEGEDENFAPRSEMVDAIAEHLKINGECSEEDLIAKNFTADEIKQHWSMSYALARVKLNWLDG